MSHRPSILVRVHTADRKGAGTDATVFFQLRDYFGHRSASYTLDNLLHDDHERGSVSQFRLPRDQRLKDIDSIVLWRNTAGADDSWFVDLVEVLEQPEGATWLFPVHRWLHGYTEYRLRQYDLSLPQKDDPDLKARRHRELTAKRDVYRYRQHIVGGPVQVGVL